MQLGEAVKMNSDSSGSLPSQAGKDGLEVALFRSSAHPSRRYCPQTFREDAAWLGDKTADVQTDGPAAFSDHVLFPSCLGEQNTLLCDPQAINQKVKRDKAVGIDPGTWHPGGGLG